MTDPITNPRHDTAPAESEDLAALRTQFDTVRQELDQANRTIAQLERRQRIDGLLREADAIDVEAGRLLTEIAIDQMDEPDVQAAVEDLKRHRPYLFRRRGSGATAMSAHPDRTSDASQQAAQQAAESGHRKDLLTYLRLRRTHPQPA